MKRLSERGARDAVLVSETGRALLERDGAELKVRWKVAGSPTLFTA
jgi:hypothetical protein